MRVIAYIPALHQDILVEGHLKTCTEFEYFLNLSWFVQYFEILVYKYCQYSSSSIFLTTGAAAPEPLSPCSTSAITEISGSSAGPKATNQA